MAWFKIEKEKLLFIHIPKTGGRALASQLKKDKYITESKAGHKSIASMSDSKNYKSFCIVRNPYERMQSFYRHFYQEKLKNVHNISFHQFVKNPPNTYHEKTQFYYVSNNKDKILVDNIFRFENKLQDVIEFLNENNIDLKFIEQFKPSNKNIECKLTDEIKEIIYKKYKKDFDYFNYEK